MYCSGVKWRYWSYEIISHAHSLVHIESRYSVTAVYMIRKPVVGNQSTLHSTPLLCVTLHYTTEVVSDSDLRRQQPHCLNNVTYGNVRYRTVTYCTVTYREAGYDTVRRRNTANSLQHTTGDKISMKHDLSTPMIEVKTLRNYSNANIFLIYQSFILN